MAALPQGLGTLVSRVAVIFSCVAATAAQAGTLAVEPVAWGSAVELRHHGATGETRLLNRVTPHLCFSLSLPQEWRLTGEEGGTSLEAVSFRAKLDVSLRSAHDLQDLPQTDLAHRDAAFLQRDYEGLLGRPAQSVSLTSPVPGATRWSATWVDANLPTAARAMTIETYIVPLSKEWVLELSLDDVPTGEAHDALVQRLLTGLQVRAGAACRG
ncbi:hypothetical protein ACFOYU_03710 [Microvirga sp. GCM10011540]|uniref:hypothetical protein n=1 Tax=Microvirga sp. GCM10011540 TaxID=3317338 RepID=UPI003619BA35